MRGPFTFLVVSLAACGSGSNPANDAGGDVDAGGQVDAPNQNGDAAPPACATPLLVGGMDVAAQGWSVQMQAPATVSYGSDYVQLQTSTSPSATTSGQLLLYRPGAVEPGQPFRIQVEMLVQAGGGFNPNDASAAIMGSFTPPSGTVEERSQILYLSSEQIGWTDLDLFAPVNTTVYHTYELSVDASGAAQVTVDGMIVGIARVNYTSNGTIAIGDQTNDPNLDSTLRIRSVCLN